MHDRCVVCGKPEVSELRSFRSLPRVTSDTKPHPVGGRLGTCAACGCVQKFSDDAFRSDISAIYRAYSMYSQSDGAEQSVFGAKGVARSRSDLLLEHALSTLERRRGAVQGSTGDGIDADRVRSFLDVGCGTGVTLSAFARRRASWRLFGQDLDSRNLDRLRMIPGFEALFAGSLEEHPKRHDLISLIHSLEHMLAPVSELTTLKRLLRPSGSLLIQVPDLASNPFDLLVADHVTHFTETSLARCVTHAGLRVETLSCCWVPKELSLLAAPGSPTDGHEQIVPDGLPPERDRALATAWIDWLQMQLSRAADSARRASVAIFGTAIAGTWLYGALSDHVVCFVDEDPLRIGRTHHGVPIVHPGEVPAGVEICVPLVPSAARAVAARHRELARRMLIPTELPEIQGVHGDR